MAIRESQIALHVRVKFNENWSSKSLGEEYLTEDKVIYIAEKHVYQDELGKYIHLKSNNFNAGRAYLNQIDLEFPVLDNGQTPKTELETKIEHRIAELEDEIITLEMSLSVDDLQDLEDSVRNIEVARVNQTSSIIEARISTVKELKVLLC